MTNPSEADRKIVSSADFVQRIERDGDVVLRFAATDHFRIRTEVRRSTLQASGRGLFAVDPAPRGTFLGLDFLPSAWLLAPEDYADVPEHLRPFCWRYAEYIYFVGRPEEERGPADHTNHSTRPNLLYMLGTYFAAEDIRPGDEIFVDYRHITDPDWPLFDDAETGEPVRGLPWREALLQSARRLVALLEESVD